MKSHQNIYGPILLRLTLLFSFIGLCSGSTLRPQDSRIHDTVPSAAITITRGPYLQMGSPNAMTIRWRTSSFTNSAVRYGTSAGQLLSKITNSNLTTEHEIRLTGLSSATKYYYSVGTTTATLAGDSSYFFHTSPAVDSTQAIRIWALGDSGRANSNLQSVRNAYDAFTGSKYTNLWLLLGDNAYDSGTDAEYQTALFDQFRFMLRQSPVWPAFGNHDAVSADSSTQTGAYYNIFTLPKSAQSGGLASGTEAYYSFDYGNIHFICLDSQESSRSPSGPMLTWLKKDIASTSRNWVIAFWHHPPYSKGSHDSDTDYRLTEMRENVLPILEDEGVDLVLSGHSHSYERSYLLDGHYDYSYTLNDSMIKDGGSGRSDSSGGPYEKASSGQAPHQGTVYTVAGSSSQTGSGTLDHPAMFLSLKMLGSVVIDVSGNRLDAKFLDQNGVIRDYYTIQKGSQSSGSIPSPPSNLSASGISTSQIRVGWADNSGNEEGFRIERSQDRTNYSEIAIVGSNVVEYINSSLPPDSAYYYRVRAYNTSGNSSYSNVDGGRTYKGSNSTEVPSAPSSLNASGISKTQIRITWSDNSSNEDGFKIERSSDAVNFSQIAIAGKDVEAFTNSSLASDHVYYYRVRAYNSSGNSAYSNVDGARTWK